jgi:HK97 family phage prohead protease
MNSKREFRYLPAKELLVEQSEDGKRTLSGYAAVFNSLSEDMGGWREQILPGAFSKCLAGNPDIVCLRDHNPSMILGRTTSGTLRVTQDEVGLRFECDLPDTTQANDLVTSLERKDINGCSFGFYCTRDNWHEDDGLEVRDVIEADVFDCSVVTYPAYPATSVSLRSLFPDGAVEPPKVVEKRDTGCQCDCPECQAGDCDNCSDSDCDDPECDCQQTRNLRLRLEIAQRV